MLILDNFFLKYEGGSQINSFQNKISSKSPGLLSLTTELLEKIKNNWKSLVKIIIYNTTNIDLKSTTNATHIRSQKHK